MLKEAPQKYVRQIKGEPKRRWFYDDDLDLVVWEDSSGKIIGFQLFYNKAFNQRALTWKVESGFSHDLVDDGENRPGKYKSTPILVEDGHFEGEKIADIFKKASGEVEDRVSRFVYEKILEYPAGMSERWRLTQDNEQKDDEEKK